MLLLAVLVIITGMRIYKFDFFPLMLRFFVFCCFFIRYTFICYIPSKFQNCLILLTELK